MPGTVANTIGSGVNARTQATVATQKSAVIHSRGPSWGGVGAGLRAARCWPLSEALRGGMAGSVADPGRGARPDRDAVRGTVSG